MKISYNKLWKLLIDKKMKQSELRRAANIAPNTLTRLYKDQEVKLDVLYRICMVLGADIGDVMEFLPEGEQEGEPERVKESEDSIPVDYEALGSATIQTEGIQTVCEPIKISPPQAAAIMQKSNLFVYEGLKRGFFPFGHAMQMPGSTRWTYYISPPQLAEYLGISLSQLVEEVRKL